MQHIAVFLRCLAAAMVQSYKVAITVNVCSTLFKVRMKQKQVESLASDAYAQ